MQPASLSCNAHTAAAGSTATVGAIHIDSDSTTAGTAATACISVLDMASEAAVMA